jgi:hypothetical protein
MTLSPVDCPNRCSGHGRCDTIADLNLYQGQAQNCSLSLGDEEWGADAVTICYCDDGFFGADCSLSKSTLFYKYDSLRSVRDVS